MLTVTKDFVKKLYSKRPDWSHKGDFGRLLIIGGSSLYSGSPILAALAAYRSGVDWVMIAAPKDVAHQIRSYSPDLMSYPLDGEFVSIKNIKTLLELEENYDAVLIGGGMGRVKEVKKTIIEFLKNTSLPCVIDADAIHAVAEEKKVIRSNFVLTPHSYEFYVLTGEKISDRAEQVTRYAQELGATILLKGHIDYISDGKQAAINKTGNPSMTKAGTGDSLAGICGALLARKIAPFDAACAAAYINGAAGDLANTKLGVSLLATDVIEEIHNVLKF